MDQYEETFKTWNNIAQLYEDIFMDMDIYNASYDKLLSHLKENDRVLEIGCGPGNITRYLLSKNNKLNIKGLDVSENMVNLAQINNPKASFEVMDVRELNQIKTTYNAIVCGFCIPYLSAENCKQLIIDSYAILNDNGLIYLSFVPGNPEDSGFISGSSGGRTFFYFHEKDFITQILFEKGFRIKDTIEIEYEKPNDEVEIHLVIMAAKA